jgi:transposase
MINPNEITDGITTGVEVRKQRGLEIAAIIPIDRKGRNYIVPSMSGNGRYTVDPVAHTCTCPDHKERNCKCKHQWAVEFAAKRETTINADGSTTVTETVAIKATKKTTYSQNWPAYNEAQTNEQDQFRRLLADLCKGLTTPPRGPRGGRPPLPLSDAVFAVVFKVYSTFSGRRFISDLRAAHADGYISRLPHFSNIFHYLENPDLFEVLKALVVESAKPLAAVESRFAADSSGFATSRFVRWFDHKYGVVRADHDWVKIHVMTGVKTNVVTAVEIKERNAGDVTQMPALMNQTAKNFQMTEVSADKAYSCIFNMEEATRHGATPFIDFKKNARGTNEGVWSKMFHFFSFKKDEFMTHYHQRSNVESTFSMIKAKFGDAVRSKTEIAMKNEALCKLLAHNICCLISAIYELGIEPQFNGICT